VRQYTSQPISEPTTLRIYGGADGEYTLYEDDGISQDYVKGRGSWTRMTWNDRAKQLTLEPGAPKGATNVATRRTFRVLLLPEGAAKEVTYSGSRVRVAF
jgi:alpha-glucosidase (family GH31 glycosyl hydrolase)